MEYISLGSIIFNLAMLIFALLAIHLGMDVYGFSYVYLISRHNFFGLLCLHSLKKNPAAQMGYRIRSMEIYDKGGHTIRAFIGIIRIYYYIDTVMISLMISNSNEAMGWYNAAYRMVLVLSFIPVTFLGAIYPIMSNYYVTSDKNLGFIFERSFKYLMALAIPIGVGTIILGDQLIFLIYGPEFAPSSMHLKSWYGPRY